MQLRMDIPDDILSGIGFTDTMIAILAQSNAAKYFSDPRNCRTELSHECDLLPASDFASGHAAGV